MELSPEFHGTFWTTFEQHPWFHGIPWNFVQIQSSMEFHGTFSILPSSMEFHGTFNFPPKSSMEFHGTFLKFHGIPWNLINFIFNKIIFPNIVFGIWLMIRCYLAKISQKRYILHWFQYYWNSYFEHPSVSENGTRSAKMAWCLEQFTLITNGTCVWHMGCLWQASKTDIAIMKALMANRNIKHNTAKLSLIYISYICAFIYHTNKSKTEYIHMSTILM